jgi:uncharacterized protein (DUF2384 family)
MSKQAISVYGGTKEHRCTLPNPEKGLKRRTPSKSQHSYL